MRELRARSVKVKKTGQGRLDRIPLEVRQSIYKCVFAGARVEIASRNLSGCTTKPIRVNEAFKTAISLFLTSSTIYEEARPCLASCLTLRILEEIELTRIRRDVKDFYVPRLRTVEFGSRWDHILDVSIFPSLEKLVLVPRVPIKHTEWGLCYIHEFMAHKVMHYNAILSKQSVERIIEGSIDDEIKQTFLDSLKGSWIGPLLREAGRRYRIFVKLNLLPCYTHVRDGLSPPAWCLKFALDDSMDTIKRVVYYKEKGRRFCKVWKDGQCELWLHSSQHNPWSRLLKEKWIANENRDRYEPSGMPTLIVKGSLSKKLKYALVGFDISQDQVVNDTSTATS
jgi:hypothetical protein